MNEWQTVFRNETGWNYKTQREKQIRMVYVDDVEAGEIVCRVFGHPDVKVQEDRARLIASAPTLKRQRDDLLEACKKAKTALNLCARVFLGTGETPEPDIMADAIIEIDVAIANCE